MEVQTPDAENWWERARPASPLVVALATAPPSAAVALALLEAGRVVALVTTVVPVMAAHLSETVPCWAVVQGIGRH